MQLDRTKVTVIGIIAAASVIGVVVFLFVKPPVPPPPVPEPVPFLRCMRLIMEKKEFSESQKSLALKLTQQILGQSTDGGAGAGIDVAIRSGTTTENRDVGDGVVIHAIDECGKQVGTAVRSNVEVSVRATLDGSPLAGVRVSDAAKESDQCETTASGACLLILHDVGSRKDFAFRIFKPNYDLVDDKKIFSADEMLKGGPALKLRKLNEEFVVNVDKRGAGCAPLVKVRASTLLRNWGCVEKGRVEPEFRCNEATGDSVTFYHAAGSALGQVTVEVQCDGQAKTTVVRDVESITIALGKEPLPPECAAAKGRIAGHLRDQPVPDGVDKFAHLHVKIGPSGAVSSVSGNPDNRLLTIAKDRLSSFVAVPRGPCEFDYDWARP